MAEQTVNVGDAIFLLTSSNAPFSDGHITGYLEFYDEWHQPAFPLTSLTIYGHHMMILHEPPMPSIWKGGRVTGWIEALMENSSHIFRSFLPGAWMTVLQEA